MRSDLSARDRTDRQKSSIFREQGMNMYVHSTTTYTQLCP